MILIYFDSRGYSSHILTPAWRATFLPILIVGTIAFEDWPMFRKVTVKSHIDRSCWRTLNSDASARFQGGRLQTQATPRCCFEIPHFTWWFIPRIVSGLYKWDKWWQCPLVTGVITHLLSGMSHQVWLSLAISWSAQVFPKKGKRLLERQLGGVGQGLFFLIKVLVDVGEEVRRSLSEIHFVHCLKDTSGNSCG